MGLPTLWTVSRKEFLKLGAATLVDLTTNSGAMSSNISAVTANMRSVKHCDGSVTTSRTTRRIYSIETELGNITIETYPDLTPVTAANFDTNVKAAAYKGGSFYRTVRKGNQQDNRIRISVVQGGARDDFESRLPIPLERTSVTGLSHRAGTISMARGSDPDSASTEFFICMRDEPQLDFGGRRNPDGQGFAAFGRVAAGMAIVRRIHEAPAIGQALAQPIQIFSIIRSR